MSLRQLLFPLALVISLVVFFMPASGVPSAPPGTDKLVHAAVFAALAATGLGAGVARLPLFLGLAGYAGLTEVLQAVLPLGRSGDPWDVLADLVGLALGWGLLRLGGRLGGRRPVTAHTDATPRQHARSDATTPAEEASREDLNPTA
ncbi:hypothetical protein FHR81_002359 [Actinoalloteichus hoggarensis]|uniref:Uncharacterized protein n=1 Tax=Actinoalloteichus hoggarensis TaxID=1470176 RepID=A0A221W694_9PSEU|nr:VanZ family protein [Actinoalloteichus hoggarensis]ASO21388.1 hypothetical protein AHOG_18815 [Actinoalloteichus hoggarensis]MBB5921321.1 hypothetical protein [Actinoalloteichus hoggarensis]